MNPPYGLILCGGQSSRMGEDKSLLNYHGRPQRYYLYDLIKPFCEQIFLSCNRDQESTIPPSCNYIMDKAKYSGIGPMAALLTAFEKFPSASFFVSGCDYPLLTEKHIRDLVQERSEAADAVCYCLSETDLYEPLFCVYENSAFKKLQQNFREGNYSLRHFLQEANTCKIIPSSAQFLKSVDDQESYQKMKELLAVKFL
jgi:molybdopterin-guanine dinucleotide biosynthesis protein A